MSLGDKTLREMGDVVAKLAKGGESILESNKAIKVADNFFGAPQAIYKMTKGEGYKKALRDTFTNKDGGLNVAKIAGSYMGVAAGARVLSGGGVYKDNRGQANLIGVPFV